MRRFGRLTLVALFTCLLPAKPQAAIEWKRNSLKSIYSAQGDFYSYAPSATTDGNTERYWFCRNRVAGVIRDHIYYLERVAGRQVVCQPVLWPDADHTWDSFHVCDPSVIAGDFRMNGARYRYAMFYLGNNVDASANNQVGVVFSNDLASEWVRYTNPVVRCPPCGAWGVGQPSAVSQDGHGRVLLFYSKAVGPVAGCLREVDCSDMEHLKIGEEITLPVRGLVQTTGRADYLNNFDVVYDAGRDRYLAVREQHPYPAAEPRIISACVQVVSIAGKDLRRPDARWVVEGTIGPELTGQARNHNAGFERTLLGRLPDPKRIRVIFSTSCAGDDCKGRFSLWTYALWQISGTFVNEPKAQ